MKLATRNDRATSDCLGVRKGDNGASRRFHLRWSGYHLAFEHGAGIGEITGPPKIGDVAKPCAGNMALTMHGIAALFSQSRSDIEFDAASLRDQSRSGTGLNRLA